MVEFNLDCDRYMDELTIRTLDLGNNEKDVSLYAPMKENPILRYMVLKNNREYDIVEIRDNRLTHEDGIHFKSCVDLKLYLCNEVQNRLI